MSPLESPARGPGLCHCLVRSGRAFGMLRARCRYGAGPKTHPRLQRVARLVPLAGGTGARAVRQEQCECRVEATSRATPTVSTRWQPAAIDANSQTLNDTLASVSGGAKQTIVLVNDNSTGNDKIIARDGIASVADLKGKKVAVEQGTVDHYLLLLALAEAKLTKDDIELVPLTTDAAAAAFVAGQVDAVGAFAPVHHHRPTASGQPGPRNLGRVSRRHPGPPGRDCRANQGPPGRCPGAGEHLVRHHRLDQEQQGRRE